MRKSKKSFSPLRQRPQVALTPWVAMLIACGLTPVQRALAQSPEEKTLRVVTVTDRADLTAGKEALLTQTTTLAKGQQALRDIPQSITVVTEKLMTDRNLQTVKEALKNTAGISFLAAEGGEEDIRLRGFSLQGTGDVFVDGIRDPAFYERDTFNLDRLEVLRGSASMLFGRGSTGGAVNQVSKSPRLNDDQHQIDVTVGSYQHRRLVADFNHQTTDNAAIRANVMHTQADNNGAGTALNKQGIATAYRWGIGEKHEFQAALFYLNNQNGINYGLPWIRPTPNASVYETTTLPLQPDAYYGLASDRNHGSAGFLTLSHTYQFSADSQLKTQIRKGSYTRDQRASTIRHCGPNATTLALNASCPNITSAVSLSTFDANAVFTRGTALKIQDMATWHVQSDLSHSFQAMGMTHQFLTGIDLATEDKTVYAARTAAQGGVDLIKPVTLVGTPNPAWINEDSRVLRTSSQYASTALGAYAQDLLQLTPQWKVLGGLRYDHLRGAYDSYGAPTNATSNGALSTYSMTVAAWSKRAGILFQPDAWQSYHVGYNTSFNTSGDAYSLGAANASTPPEQSANIEVGARLLSTNKQFSTRLAVFQTTKKNERNTDPLLLVPGTSTPLVTLTGERYARGVEIDLAGRLTPLWEVFGSFTWIPDAKVTRAAPCPTTGTCSQNTPGDRVGDRPTLIPTYSGSLWSTYRLNADWRVGGGVTFRGSQKPIRSDFEVPAFVIADAMAEYTVNEAWSFKLNMTNISNRYYADQLYVGHYVPGLGRLTQLTATYRF